MMEGGRGWRFQVFFVSLGRSLISAYWHLQAEAGGLRVDGGGEDKGRLASREAGCGSVVETIGGGILY